MGGEGVGLGMEFTMPGISSLRGQGQFYFSKGTCQYLQDSPFKSEHKKYLAGTIDLHAKMNTFQLKL